MKKVLILAYDFPPYVSVGGLRPYNWYKYLHEFGIYPIVVTRQWENKYGNYLDYIAPGESDETIVDTSEIGTVIRTPYYPNLANRLMLKYENSKYTYLRKSISAYYEFVQFLFFVGSKASLYFEAKKYLKIHDVDVIIATGDPFILFRYASRLGRDRNTPWIADYRDPWSEKSGIQNNFLLKKWNKFFEKKIVGTASLITTVSTFFQNNIERVVKNKKFYILPNGYDPQAMAGINSIKQNSQKFSIAYVGYIYDWHPIESFFKVISELLEKHTELKLQINFYGINKEKELEHIIEKKFSNISPLVNIHPKTPNTLLLEKLAEQNLMLLFNYYSFPGTKIYDYIGIKRAILFCYTNDAQAAKLRKEHYPYKEVDGLDDRVQENLIRETNSGYIIRDELHLAEVLIKLYGEFEQNGYIQCNTINEENYSRKHQVKQLAEIVKNIS